MSEEKTASGMTRLADSIYSDILENEYLQELYDRILQCYTLKLFQRTETPLTDEEKIDALRFADILSKSPDDKKSELHKSLAQEIVTLLNYLFPDDEDVLFYAGSVLTNTSNFRGKDIIAPNYKSSSFFDQLYSDILQDYLKVPGDESNHFFLSQKQVYDRISNNQCFSYSGPTSMGKSFVMRTFIRAQIEAGKTYNFAILVPTKALINEVTSELTEALRPFFTDSDYRIVTSAGAVVLKDPHHFIFVMTPERMAYLLTLYRSIPVDYVFIDEAHKISAKDSRSAFYYSVVEKLSNRRDRTRFVFASPNIPNPDVYLQLIPKSSQVVGEKFSTNYTPVAQVKLSVDLYSRHVHYYDPLKKGLTYATDLDKKDDFYSLLEKIGGGAKNLVYCNSKAKVIEYAQAISKRLKPLNDPELDALAEEIRDVVYPDYYLAETIKKGVAYHVGYLPAALRLRVEELFRKENKIHTIVCTSTLLEGVNLPADNLFVTHYLNGRKPLDEVSFKNLLGRVGRIQYNLYGNVFLMTMQDGVDPQKYVEMLKAPVPEQELSVSTSLSVAQKKTIVQCLVSGSMELDKPDSQNLNEYSLMRKFMILLLRSILTGKDSRVRKEFKDVLTPLSVELIKESFEGKEEYLEDLNITLDQSDRLFLAIKNGLHYPKLNIYGYVAFEELMTFLEQLCDIFNWDKYERGLVGKKQADGRHPVLRKNAVTLANWLQGMSIQAMVKSSIDYKKSSGQKVRLPNHKFERYIGSKEQNNLIAADILNDINEVILFSFSNYFMAFSSAYKDYIDQEAFSNDWYEYVEYGSVDPFIILLQRNGFSREAAIFIAERQEQYTTISEGEQRLTRTLLHCGKATIEREARMISINMPELFAQE